MGFAQPRANKVRTQQEYSPSNYTPSPVTSESTNRVSAHLNGIDNALGAVSIDTVKLTGETIDGGVSDGDPIYYDGVNWKKATSGTDRPNGVKSGTSGEVVLEGVCSGLTGLTAGTDYYLDPSGGLTTIQTDMFVGVGLSTTELSVDLDRSQYPSSSPGLYDKQTATAGQTVFDLSGVYQVGANSLWVFRNGVRQTLGVTYNETDADTVTFTSGLNAGDEVLFIQISTGPNGLVRNDFTATAGQTVFDLSFFYNVGQDELIVYSGGALMRLTDDYTETDGDTITFVSGRSLGEKVTIMRVSSVEQLVLDPLIASLIY